MPLQNRVTPYGEVVVLPGRGQMMGNRGILHDESRRVVRPFAVKRWIACVLEFRGRKRDVMTPHRYTELFFLDEAAALSAGHRPCAECRRGDYNRFRTFWEESIGRPNDADSMDLRLHADRLDGKRKRTYRAELASLPDGAYVVWDERPHLVWGRSLLEWSDAGYIKHFARPKGGRVEVLTPRAIVEVLAAGYRPAVHPSAE
ncbi:MAG TPA: hypothetical protein VGI19_04455 [Candidatus Cybelea sp.]|jgi:hypothetical protein